MEKIKAQFEQQKTADLSRADKEKILLQGFVTMWSTPGVVVAPELKALEAEVIKNVALPLFAENQVNGAAMAQASQMHQLMDQQDQQNAQNNQPVDPNQPPQQQQPQQNQPQPQAA